MVPLHFRTHSHGFSISRAHPHIFKISRTHPHIPHPHPHILWISRTYAHIQDFIFLEYYSAFLYSLGHIPRVASPLVLNKYTTSHTILSYPAYPRVRGRHLVPLPTEASRGSRTRSLSVHFDCRETSLGFSLFIRMLITSGHAAPIIIPGS